jgi:hypothetical protein
VNALGDSEELGRRIDNDPLGGDAQGVHQGDQGLEDFGYSSTKGGAVDMNDSQVAQVTGHRRKLVSQLGGYQRKIILKWNHRLS